MKKFLLLFIVFCSLLVSSISSACDNTISSASTSGDDEIFYQNSSDDNKKACVTSTGSLIVSDHDNNGLVRFKNADNVELVNEGTLQIGLYEGVGTYSSENNTVVAKDGSSIGVTVTNSGIIAASGNLAVNLKAADGNITVTNNAGAIITSSSSSGAATLNLSSVGSA